MRRLFLLPVVALALPLLFAPTVAAAVNPQPPDTIATSPTWNISFVPGNTVAQTFTTPNKVERLDYVEIFMTSTNGGTVEAWVKAGAPGTSGISGTDVTAAVPPGAQNLWIDLTPPTGIILAANSQYSVMFRVTDGTNTTKVQGNSNGSLYTGGAAYAYDGAAWNTPAGGIGDLSVTILMSPLPGTLDQQQNTHDHSVGYIVMAQTFTAGVSGTIKAVSLWTEGAESSTELSVEICSVSEGIDCTPPAGNAVQPALDTGVLAVSASVLIPGGIDQWFDFVFSTPPTVVAGTQYAIVTTANAGWCGSTSNAYGGGSALNGSGGGWSSINGDPVYDLAFQTFVTPNGATAPPTSAAELPGKPGDPAPLPLLLAIASAIPVVGVILVKRYGVVTRR